MIEHGGLLMDPQVINILIGSSVIYGVATLLLMAAMVRAANKILKAANRSADAIEAMNAKS